MDAPNLPEGINPDDLLTDLGGQPVGCGPCHREGREVAVAYLSFNWDRSRWELRGASGHPFDIVTDSLRQPVALRCPSCQRALGEFGLGRLVKRRDSSPLFVG